MEKLSKKQQAIFDFMQNFQMKNSYWPSIRDIQTQFDFASTNSVFRYIELLEAKGILQRINGAARAYKIVTQTKEPPLTTTLQFEGPGADAIPLEPIQIAGHIAAGLPDFTESSGVLETLQVPISHNQRRRTPQSFALRVRGDSMVDANINDGDTVIVEPGVPKHGDIVAALIDGQTTLKRLIKQGSKVYLKAENKNYPNLIPTTSLTIQGIAKSVMKQL